MAPVKITRVVSFSSEDPVHKADNLLKTDSTRRWKCKTKGEKEAIVILQFAEQVQISGVDIGNECSAFVEVLAAKSCSPDDYHVLLPAISMMSVQDSKQCLNSNSVRIIKQENLLLTDESWDRIKVVCSQPFNKYIQYGLSFITLHSSSLVTNEPLTPAADCKKLGNFLLQNTEENGNISPGSWFSKRAAISPPKEYVKKAKTSLIEENSNTLVKTSALAIRKDTSAKLVRPSLTSGLKKGTSSKSVKAKKIQKSDDDVCGRIDVTVASSNARLAKGGPLLYVSDEEEGIGDSSENKYLKKVQSSKNSNDLKNISQKEVLKQRGSSSHQESNAKLVNSKDKATSYLSKVNDNSNIKTSQKNSTNTTSSHEKTRKQKKPFDHLLEGVTFVISGFENPLRGDLRSQALEMGAFYKANWDNTCSHLICAFPNTPKCRSVQSLGGKIVTKDWVQDCYNHCKRLPWRRYALLPADQAYSESEEEIEVESPVVPANKFRLLRNIPTSSLSSATSSESQSPIINTSNQKSDDATSIPFPYTKDKLKNPSCVGKTCLSQDTSESSQSKKVKTRITQDSNSDTDIDDNVEYVGNVSCRVFQPLFRDLNFLLHSSLQESDKENLFRYITTYGGHCYYENQDKYTPIAKTNVSGDHEYIVVETINDRRKTNSKSKYIQSDWIWNCIKQSQLISHEEYLLSL